MVHFLSPHHHASGEKDMGACFPETVGRLAARHLEALHRVLGMYQHALVPVHLTPDEFVILAEVAARETGKISPDELAATLQFDDGTLGQYLRTLERDGCLRLHTSVTGRPDGRVELTAKGCAQLQLARPLWEHAHSQLEAVLGQPGITALRDGLMLLASLELAVPFRSKTFTS